jgi:hypothetical protein
MRRLGWDLHKASMSHVLQTVQQQVDMHELIVDSIGLTVDANPTLITDRTKFLQFTNETFITYGSRYPSLTSLQIIDYRQPSKIRLYYFSLSSVTIVLTIYFNRICYRLIYNK